MTAPAPSGWRDSVLRWVWTVLAVAVMLYVAARLIEAVWPILVVVGVVVLVGFAGWRIVDFRRSKW
jgi:hypothetical protein